MKEPAGFTGEAMDDSDESDWWTIKWSPPLGEEFKAGRVGDVGRGVCNRVAGVEFSGGERAEGACGVSL